MSTFQQYFCRKFFFFIAKSCKKLQILVTEIFKDGKKSIVFLLLRESMKQHTWRSRVRQAIPATNKN